MAAPFAGLEAFGRSPTEPRFGGREALRPSAAEPPFQMALAEARERRGRAG